MSQIKGEEIDKDKDRCIILYECCFVTTQNRVQDSEFTHRQKEFSYIETKFRFMRKI